MSEEDAPLWLVRRTNEDEPALEKTDLKMARGHDDEDLYINLPEYKSLTTEFNSELDEISFYHVNVNRHVAESLLLQNGVDGTFLLRPSSKDGELALSVRCKDSVKHFPIKWDGEVFHFGLDTYHSLEVLTRHLLSRPLLGSESGTLTSLKQPYPRDVEEPVFYDTVKVHIGSVSRSTTEEPPTITDFTVASKEGYLTKQGKIVKNWKMRWFTLQKNELRYYRSKTDKEPIRVLDLLECDDCSRDFSNSKDNCFSLDFPYRTYYVCAGTKEELTEWMELINWKLKHKEQLKQVQEDNKTCGGSVNESLSPNTSTLDSVVTPTTRMWYSGADEIVDVI